MQNGAALQEQSDRFPYSETYAYVSLLGVYTNENCVSSSETLTRLDPFVGFQVRSSLG